MALEEQKSESRTGRAVKIHNKKVSWEELTKIILDLIEEGANGTGALATALGKTTKQARSNSS